MSERRQGLHVLAQALAKRLKRRAGRLVEHPVRACVGEITGP